MRLPSWLILIPGLLLLTACTGFSPPAQLTGASKDQVVARMGQPDTQRQLADGVTRLEYPTGPYGLHTWFVDLDATGKAVRAEQVLTEHNFNQVLPDMAQADVRQRLGRPNAVFTLGRSRGEVWNYRFEGPFCQWFQVEFSIDKTVRTAGYGERPECDRPEWLALP